MARMRFKFKRPINAVGISILAALAIGVFNIPDKGGNNSPKYALSQWSKPAVVRQANADDSKGYGSVRVNRVISVYDGDTIRLDIDEWPPVVGKNISIRILGVDTPEIRGKCPFEKKAAKQARDFVYNRLKSAKSVELHLHSMR